MISVRPPAGATMAYRLDPYSFEVISAKPKSMHDVVEPTILFYHRKGLTGSPGSRTPNSSGKKSQRSPQQHQAGSPSAAAAPRSPPVCSNATPGQGPSSPSTPATRYVAVSTATQANTTMVAPFRVTNGDNVVFLASNRGEHFGTVTHVYDTSYVVPDSTMVTPRRLIRKARSVDQENQRRNVKQTEVVRSTITAVLQNLRPGGFVPSNLAAVEWQLDRSVVHVVLDHNPELESDLHNLYLSLVKNLGTEVQILTILSSASSPALSDCSSSEPSVGDFSPHLH